MKKKILSFIYCLVMTVSSLGVCMTCLFVEHNPKIACTVFIGSLLSILIINVLITGGSNESN